MAEKTKPSTETSVEEVRARARFQRMSPRKVRRVADVIRGKGAREAEAMLGVLPHRSARLLKKVLHAAIANAENNYHLNPTELVVTKAVIDAGPMLKRFQPRARGRAFPIHKPMCHVLLSVKAR